MDGNKSEIKKLAQMDFAGKEIMVVEDNEFNSEILTTVLKKTGVNVTCAFDGTEAVELFEKSQVGFFDLILMDVQMPVMNGTDASKKIRQMDRRDAKTIPIIAVSANAFSNDVEETKAAGMNDHIAKPINFKILKDVLEKYL